MRGGRIILALMAALAVGTGTGLLDRCLRGPGGFGDADWPRLSDPAALRREAAALCRGAGGWRELQPAEYPPAITAQLHPASISVSSERVYVELVPVAGGRSRYHGYYIWPSTTDRPDGGIARDESDGDQVPGS